VATPDAARCVMVGEQTASAARPHAVNMPPASYASSRRRLFARRLRTAAKKFLNASRNDAARLGGRKSDIRAVRASARRREAGVKRGELRWQFLLTRRMCARAA